MPAGGGKAAAVADWMRPVGRPQARVTAAPVYGLTEQIVGERIPAMTLAITYRRPGDPADVLEVTDIGDVSPPAPGQVQVQVAAFPIHPGDLLAIAAGRPSGPEPWVAGAEATGVITDVGSGVAGFSPGARVTFFPHNGAWSEIVNVDTTIAVPVPDSLPDEIAAQMVCNPITVVMLRRAAERHFSVGYDGVLLNNAAASAVGRLFTAMALYHQIASISIVRSEQRAQQLREKFPTVPVVSTSSPNWTDEVRVAAGGRPIPVALDPVGGADTTDLLSLVSAGGTVFVYGALADTNITLHAGDMLNSERAIRGLSIARWLVAVPAEKRASDLACAVLIAEGLREHFDTAAIYPLDHITDAVRHVTRPGKLGTVLVKL
jgi:NADPH:quinone reductase-like Zn-dependent oxidoreductase